MFAGVFNICINCFVQQAPSALAWGEDGDADGAGVGSDSDEDEEGGDAVKSQERKEIKEAMEAAETAARETAEEKRLRLARDVLLKLDAEQRENVRGHNRVLQTRTRCYLVAA